VDPRSAGRILNDVDLPRVDPAPWRPAVRYHPILGHTFIPGLRARVPHVGGGYAIRVNAAGFRCDHELHAARPPGTRRVLLFGDSFTAGDGVSNGERFGDLLPALVGGEMPVQVLNFGLPGTSPDQHYLAFREHAPALEHDLVIVAVMVENVRRLAARYWPYRDARGAEVLRPKPYFTLEPDGALALHHVPVPPGPLPMPPRGARGHVYRGLPFFRLRAWARRLGVRDLLQRVTRFQPVPEYARPDHPRWLLLRAILSRWVEESRAPVLVMPLPLFPHVEGTSDAEPYRARFRELAAGTGCLLHDPLPDFLRCPRPERAGFHFSDAHPTPAGHAVIAASLAPAVRAALGSAARAAP